MTAVIFFCLAVFAAVVGISVLAWRHVERIIARWDAERREFEQPRTMATFERCARGELTPEQAAELMERDLDAVEGDFRRVTMDMRAAIKRQKDKP